MKKRILAIILALSALIVSVLGVAACYTDVINKGSSENLNFELQTDTNSYSVSGIGSCTDKNIVIPSVYSDLPVTSIGLGAFNLCTEITSITIPDSVTSIGYAAFSGCSGLTSISISESVTNIERFAFYGCSKIKSITIPESVTNIGIQVFGNCKELTNIIVAKDNKIYHSTGNCLIETASKTLIAGCKNSIIPTDNSVASIGNYAFCECYELTDIKIPDNITIINSSAFAFCQGVTSIIIPNSVTEIDSRAFWCCKALTDVTIPNSVTEIGYSAFESCSALRNLYFTGTKKQWNTVIKYYDWNNETTDFIITCTDGKLDKDGNEIKE